MPRQGLARLGGLSRCASALRLALSAVLIVLVAIPAPAYAQNEPLTETEPQEPEQTPQQSPPAAPAQPTITAGDGRLDVSWSKVEDATGYRVQWRLGPDEEFDASREGIVDDADTTAYSITGLTNHVDHTVRVQAFNTAGDSAWSETASGTPEPSLPVQLQSDEGASGAADLVGKMDAPTVTPGDEQLVVSWTAPSVSGIAAYWLQWDPRDTSDEYMKQLFGSPPATTWTIANLTNGTQYSVKVRGRTSAQPGYGAFSDAVTGTPRPDTPAKPGTPTITAGDGTLSVSWTAAARATGYKVQWKSGDQIFGSSRQVRVTGASTTTATITGLTGGTTYTVQVIGTNTHGDGDESDTATGTPTSAAPAKPAAPTVTAGAGTLALSWTAPSANGAAITGYKVQWKSGQQTFGSSRQASATSTSHTINGLDIGTTYTVRVQATNSVGDSSWSDTATGTPTVPIGVTLLPSTVAENDAATTVTVWLKTSEPGSCTEYSDASVVVGKSTDTATEGTDYSTVADLTMTGISSCLGSTTFTLTPTADSNDTESSETITVEVSRTTGVTFSHSATLTLTNAIAPPAQPTGLKLTPGDTTIGVSWTAVSRATGYKVQWRLDGEDFASTRQNTVTGGATTTSSITSLTNGKDYTVRVLATAVTVDGPPSSTVTTTPAKVPSAPAKPTVKAGNTQLAVTWAAPADNGSKISGYKVQWKTSGQHYDNTRQKTVTGATANRTEVTGLTNSTAYTVRVAAFNAQGDSSWSPSSDAGTPATGVVPDAPPLDVAPGNAQLTATWTVPADNGTSISGYKLQWRSGIDEYGADGREHTINAANTTSYTITQLPNATTYGVRLLAISSAGDSAWSTIFRTVGTPSKPVVTVTPGNETLQVSWTTPSNNGASITNYVIDVSRYNTSQYFWESVWNQAGNYSNNTVTATGLTNGSTYRVRVDAANSRGRGPGSDYLFATAGSTDAAPDAPTGLKLTRGTTSQLAASWTAPSANGSTISSYSLQWKSGSESFSTTRQADVAGTSRNITGLTDGTTYSVRVRANSSLGASDWSSVKMGQPGTAAAAKPDAPTALAITGLNRQITVGWTEPTDNGATVSSYTVQWKSGTESFASTRQATATGTSHTITGLANGTSYTVQVRATNSVGDSAWSTTASGTPAAVPSSLTPKLIPGNKQLRVVLPATDSNGSPITRYTVEWKSGAQVYDAIRRHNTVDGSVTEYKITGLTNNTSYTVRARAHNAVGSGQWTEATATVAHAEPDAPIITAIPGNNQMQLNWTADDNGSRITSYVLDVRSSNSDIPVPQRNVGTATSRTILGLTNGRPYAVSLYAYNGSSSDTTRISVTPNPRVPDAPTAPTVTASHEALDLAWTHPDHHGQSINGYKVQWKSGAQDWSTTLRQTLIPRLVSGHKITGLDDGTLYTVRIAARNPTGFSGWSPTATGTPTVQAPDPPTPTITPGNTQLTVSWEEPLNHGSIVTGYKLQWKSGVQPWDATNRQTTITGATTGSSVISTLTAGTAYDVRMQTTSSSPLGDSAWSSIVTASTTDVPEAPAAPTLHPGNQRIHVVWTAPADNGSALTGYHVQWKSGTQQFASTRQKTLTDGTATDVTISQLTNNTSYTVRMRAVNSLGNSAWSATSTATASPTKPDAPANAVCGSRRRAGHSDMDGPG